VREARANIATELQDNRKELQKTMDRFDAMYKRLSDAADKVDAMSTSWDPAVAIALFAQTDTNAMYRYYVADLRDASHSTVQATGALGYMDYAEVKKYADVYGLQADYIRQPTPRSTRCRWGSRWSRSRRPSTSRTHDASCVSRWAT
jgi:hypothetical protein